MVCSRGRWPRPISLLAQGRAGARPIAERLTPEGRRRPSGGSRPHPSAEPARPRSPPWSGLAELNQACGRRHRSGQAHGRLLEQPAATSASDGRSATRVVVFSPSGWPPLTWLRGRLEAGSAQTRSREARPSCCTEVWTTSDPTWTSSRSSVQTGQLAQVRVLVTGDVASEGVNLHTPVPRAGPLRHPVVA